MHEGYSKSLLPVHVFVHKPAYVLYIVESALMCGRLLWEARFFCG